MRKIMLAICATTVLSVVSGCAVFGVYRIDIPQGSPLTQAQVGQIKIGMTPAQVRYILGNPSIEDPLSPQRWDYVYHYTPGTYARQAGFKAVNDQHLVLFFDDNKKLLRIEGQASIPEKQLGLPPSKDTRLLAPPL